MVHKDNAVFFTALHGTGGARRDAPGIFAMKAWHENIGSTRLAIN
jgi:hypothetical protein